ncbi:MFS transporter [Blastococcus sp. MG754426]|uniref:MFS transporter n=1 Tax=unclassified Blastococcus TaxID=2619396 RepID=UPI001EF14737|nr:MULTISPECIES: MFS transporter [unclassified Blastococcus]MCF6506467.1 MFS transporter [Blastococcus sp. MG754426]MCF6511248.1 MFS transporter [Blastococcus sp. MG754427]MCF6734524.1 MFS transporter [Blastococcus sp. KM273129]
MTAPPPVGAGLRMGTARGRWVLLATVLGSGVAMLDATVVNVALERIGSDLGADFAGLQWTVNAYTLTLAALILLGGSLSDRYGRRRIFVVGVCWFALASLLCGLAPNIETLVAARALQGIGGALLTPGSLAIISASFSGPDRAAAVGAWSGLSGVAAAVGPFVGGWLVEWSWRAVFLINLPLAALVVLVAVRHVPESRDPAAAPRLDWAGTALVALGLGALTYALTAAGEGGVAAATWLWGAAGIVGLAAFVAVERRSRHPLVPPSLFAERQFTAANAVTLFVYAALGALFVLLVLHLQVVPGFSPLLAGTALLPVTVLMLLFSARVGALAQRIGPRPLLTAGPLVAAGGVLLMLRIGPDASYLLDVLPGALLFGAGLTLLVAPLTATVLDSAPDRYAGVASGVNNAVARAAGLLAVAVVPVAAGIGGTDYTDPEAFADGFRAAMLILAGLLVAGALLALLYVRRPLGDAAAETPVQPSGPGRVHIEEYPQCPVAGPAVLPREDAPAPGGRSTSS